MASDTPRIRPAPTESPDPRALGDINVTALRITYTGVRYPSLDITRSKLAAQKRAEEAFRKLREGATFASAQGEYGDPISTALSEDALAYSRMLFTVAAPLKVNELSDIIDSPFGFVIVQRLPAKERAGASR